MRVLLITVGSRGDAEFSCALAQVLANAGHDTNLFLQIDHQHLAPTLEHVSIHTLPFTSLDFYKYANNPRPEHDHPNPRVKFTGIICDVCANLVLPCTNQVLETCKQDKPNVIVASSLARHLAMAVSTKLEIPCCLVQLQPLVPTRDFPHYSRTDDCVAALMACNDASSDENLESYLELERFQYKFIQEAWQAVYNDLGIAFPTVEEVLSVLVGKNGNIVMVNACSNQLIPEYSLGDNVWNVGALADDHVLQDVSLPPELVDFLNAQDSKPICIGYGSMPFDKTQILVDALQQTNGRAVLVGSAMKPVQDIVDKDQIFVIESAPYALLLPECSMMLSHGGAGVVHAALRAGIPSIISGLLGDQFFWSKLLEAKALGVVAGSLPELTVETLVESIEMAKKCTEACEQVGKTIREQESGAKRMVRLLEERFADS